MSQQNPSPRKAVVAFGVPMTQLIINNLGAFIANDGTPWEAEDAIYAYRDHSPADREAWHELETLLSTRLEIGPAMALVEGLANGGPPGQPPNPTSGTEDQVLEIWAVHLQTPQEYRERMRALSRKVATRDLPSAVLAALTAAVTALPAQAQA